MKSTELGQIWRGPREMRLGSTLVLVALFTMGTTGNRVGGHANAWADAVMQGDSGPTYESVYQELMDLTPRYDKIAAVNGLTLQRDVATFTMHQGVMYLLSPAGGRTVAALFQGEGTFSFTPPTQVEREQLHGFYETESLNERFRTLFLLFADSTLEDDHFYVTEIPYTHGQAFPGLIHLSLTTFYDEDEPGWDQIFRAHEMAHQWWGLGVRPKTYHDEWLSEGFAMFAGLWYLETMLSHEEACVEQLTEWREAIYERGQETGPIWLGVRTSTVEHPDNFDLIVYRKGGWVVHMLRGLMRDLSTLSDVQFGMMLKEFYTQSRGKTVTTEDFKQLVERYTGMDMSWFFDQWVYGTQLPIYDFAYDIQETADGAHQVRLRIVQHEVDEDFKMFVPLEVRLGDAQALRMRVLVTGDTTEAELPPLQVKPDSLVLNPDEAVLAEVRTVRYE